MRRVNAQRSHTQVVKSIPVRNRSYMKFVGQTMRQDQSPLPVNLLMEIAIPVAANGSAPQPTRLGFPDFRVESDANRLRYRSTHTRNYTTIYTEFIGRALLAQTAPCEAAS